LLAKRRSSKQDLLDSTKKEQKTKQNKKRSITYDVENEESPPVSLDFRRRLHGGKSEKQFVSFVRSFESEITKPRIFVG
jgi:hypothetical protein